MELNNGLRMRRRHYKRKVLIKQFFTMNTSPWQD